MKPDFRTLMLAAARFARAGELKAATAAVRAALSGGGGRPAPSPSARRQHAEIVDAHTQEVSETPDLQSPYEDAAVPPVTHAPPAETPPPEVPPVTPTIEAPVVPQTEETPDDETPPPPVQDVEPAPLPLGEEQFIAGHFRSVHGNRDFKLYVPPQAAQVQPLPLVVMLHGCTQDPDDFATGTRMNEVARERGFFVLYPAQSGHANPHRCWNWFKHIHQRSERGEPALIAALTREVMGERGVDTARVYVAGLSAGGAMAAILGATHPELFAAVAVHSGLRAGAANDVGSALAAMKYGPQHVGESTQAHGIPTIVFHGDADDTVHPSNAQHVIRAATVAAPMHTQRDIAAGGRAYTRHVYGPLDAPALAEEWIVHGLGHAWSGGNPAGSYADAQGPDATAEIVRFFEEHALTVA